jgi:hypothetical protein
VSSGFVTGENGGGAVAIELRGRGELIDTELAGCPSRLRTSPRGQYGDGTNVRLREVYVFARPRWSSWYLPLEMIWSESIQTSQLRVRTSTWVFDFQSAWVWLP